jgi:hypothetical protein
MHGNRLVWEGVSGVSGPGTETAGTVAAAGGGRAASAVPGGLRGLPRLSRSSRASGSACTTGTCSPSPSTPAQRNSSGGELRPAFGGGTWNGDHLPARSCKPLDCPSGSLAFLGWSPAGAICAGDGFGAGDRGGAVLFCRGFIPARTVAGMTAASGRRSATRSCSSPGPFRALRSPRFCSPPRSNRRDARKGGPAHASSSSARCCR